MYIYMVDVVQQDFCEAVGHIDVDKQPHKRVYLRKVLPLGIEDVGSLGDCDISDIDVQWKSRGSECVLLDESEVVPDPPQRPGPNDATTNCVNPFGISASLAWSTNVNIVFVLSAASTVILVAFFV